MCDDTEPLADALWAAIQRSSPPITRDEIVDIIKADNQRLMDEISKSFETDPLVTTEEINAAFAKD